MSQKKKVKFKQTNKAPSSISQSNKTKIYSLNPFQPNVHIMQTKSGVIKINQNGGNK